MPQLDQFTYFSQFFWLCLFFVTFYIFICNDRDGVLAISRILKLRNQLLSHQKQGKTSLSKDPLSLEELLIKGFSTGVSYMYASLSEVSQWCQAVNLVGKSRTISLISCFGEICASRGMERNILYNLSKSSPESNHTAALRWITTCKHCRNDLMLIHVLHGQASIK